MSRLTHWKYFIGPGLWREQSTLYRTLDEALVCLSHHDRLGVVPGGHAPWKAFIGRPAHETTLFRSDLAGLPWAVVRVFTYRDGETSETYLAEFGTALDAFAFAELKTTLAKQRGDASDTFYVTLQGWTVDGRHPELARMPANHLKQLYRQRENERARRERLAEKRRLAA